MRAHDIALDAAYFLLRMAHCGIGPGKWGRQLRDFQNSEHLAFLDVIADIHVDHADVARDFGMNIHILKGLEFAGDGQRVAEIASLDSRYGNRSVSASWYCMVWFIRLCPRSADQEPDHRRRASQNSHDDPQFFLSHTCIPSK